MVLRDISVLHRCANVYYQSHEMNVQKFTGADPALIYFVYKNSPVNQDKIVKFFMMDRATITKSIDRLEQAGYLSRECDPEDRRAKIISITDSGLEAAKYFRETMQVWEEIILKDFSQEESKEFSRLCNLASKNAWEAVGNQHKEKDEDK